MLTDAESIRSKLFEVMELDTEDSQTGVDVEICEGASFVPCIGFRGLRIKVPFSKADSVIQLYNKYDSQPLISEAIFYKAEDLNKGQIDAVQRAVDENKTRIRDDSQRFLESVGANIPHFFAHVGVCKDINDIHSPMDGSAIGICTWTSSSLDSEQRNEFEEILKNAKRVADLRAKAKGGEHQREEDEFEDVNDMMSMQEEQATCDQLETQISTDFEALTKTLRGNASITSSSYAYFLAKMIDLPVDHIENTEKRRLYADKASSVNKIRLSGESIIITLSANEVSPATGGKALVNHSPLCGTTVYSIEVPSDKESSPIIADCMGRRPDKGKMQAIKDGGIQITPTDEMHNEYASYSGVESSFRQNVVHPTAWSMSEECMHVGSMVYIVGAPANVSSSGISTAADLSAFLDAIVPPSDEDTKVYVPDRHGKVCDILRDRCPTTWLDLINASNALRNDEGTITGWMLPYRAIAGKDN